MRCWPSLLTFLLIFLSAELLRGQEPGQMRRFFRTHGVSLLTPTDSNREWRQKLAGELPPGNLWAAQSYDQTHSLTLRAVDSRGDSDLFAQEYAKLLEAEVGRLGLKLSAATATSLGPWPAWRMEFVGRVEREEASQVTWLIAANARVYDLSCLVGGKDAAKDPIVAGFAKGFEFIELPNPAPSAETWTSRAGSGIRWFVALGAPLLCGGLGMLKNRIVSGWALGVGATFLGLAGTWWWTLPASVAGAVPLCLKLSPATERKLEVVSLLFGAGCLIALMIKAFV